ncbi:hypothetical protein SAMN02910369_02442 [Lachnospiraceae bacterium NE2001]|nr:hypothetical protein SAMN02910369_02442 [Lachnospiraceae bacterium NE2001]
MLGPGGRYVTKMNWDEFVAYQRWDEFPEKADNPPLTVETVFWYNNTSYMITKLGHMFVIVESGSFKRIISSDNYIELLTKVFVSGKSFKELLPDILIED